MRHWEKAGKWQDMGAEVAVGGVFRGSKKKEGQERDLQGGGIESRKELNERCKAAAN